MDDVVNSSSPGGPLVTLAVHIVSRILILVFVDDCVVVEAHSNRRC
jgi:hypothetical protein